MLYEKFWRNMEKNLGTMKPCFTEVHIFLPDNNCLTKWRLGAWDIQELTLLTASSQMETAPMAGKSRQPSHEPPCQAGGTPSRLGIAQRKEGLMAREARAPKRNAQIWHLVNSCFMKSSGEIWKRTQTQWKLVLVNIFLPVKEELGLCYIKVPLYLTVLL